MSRYVRRCTECRQVRGVSSFRVLRNDGGGRSDRCRVCEAADHAPHLEAAALRSELAPLLRAQSDLREALAVVARRARAIELQLRAIDRQDSAVAS